MVSITCKLLQKSSGRLRGGKALEDTKGLGEALWLGWNRVQRTEARWLLLARGLISPFPDPTQLVAGRRHSLATLPSLSLSGSLNVKTGNRKNEKRDDVLVEIQMNFSLPGQGGRRTQELQEDQEAALGSGVMGACLSCARIAGELQVSGVGISGPAPGCAILPLANMQSHRYFFKIDLSIKRAFCVLSLVLCVYPMPMW